MIIDKYNIKYVGLFIIAIKKIIVAIYTNIVKQNIRTFTNDCIRSHLLCFPFSINNMSFTAAPAHHLLRCLINFISVFGTLVYDIASRD